jgi:predicted metal-dependent phosphoesterase TrpH
MSEGYVDLHTHTTASDGTMPPRDNVRLAKEAGLSAVAITDHDTIAGLPEAMEEGKRIGIHVVPGVEISTVGNGQDIHILGYYFDMEDAQFHQRLKQLRETRDRRNEMMLEKLRSLGIPITLEEVLEHAAGEAEGETIGRPHIAEVLIRKGYAEDMRQAFDRYLGKTGKAYVNPPRIHPFEAVDWIHEAGGTAVIAHPGLYGDDGLVEDIIRHGADGIEAMHSDHSEEDEARYSSLARRYGLIITAGSDFHGERHGNVFHGPIGNRKTSVDVLSRLNKKG